MNVEIGAEAAQFQEKEYINGIAFAVYVPRWDFTDFNGSSVILLKSATSDLSTKVEKRENSREIS